jgi:hypothetical protein
MDQRLIDVLKYLHLTVDMLNKEIVRFARSNQFTETAECMQLIESIRDSCTCSIQALNTVERALRYSALRPPPDGEDTT